MLSWALLSQVRLCQVESGCVELSLAVSSQVGLCRVKMGFVNSIQAVLI